MHKITISSCRKNLLITGGIPLFVAIVASTLLYLVDDPKMIPSQLVTGVVATLCVVIYLYTLTSKLDSLVGVANKAAAEINLGNTKQSENELDRISLTIEKLSRDLLETKRENENLVQYIYDNLVNLGNIDLANMQHVDINSKYRSLRDAVAESHRKYNTLKQRFNYAIKMINDLPIGIVGIDKSYKLRYINAAAEELLNIKLSTNTDIQFNELISIADATNDPLGRNTVDKSTFIKWIQSASKEEVIMSLKGKNDYRLSSIKLFKMSGINDTISYILMRDITEEIKGLIRQRGCTRVDTAKSIWGFSDRFCTDALNLVVAHAKILNNEIKQTPSRTTLLPHMTQMLHYAQHIEAYFRITRWLNWVISGQVPEPLESEFKAVQAVNNAIQALQSKLKSRGITFTIYDDGSWMYADIDWVATALMGIIVYLVENVEQSTLSIYISNVQDNSSQAEGSIMYEVKDISVRVGQELQKLMILSDHEQQSVQRGDCIYGGAELGIFLASELVRALGGSLVVDGGAASSSAIKLMVPARVARQESQPNTDPNMDLTPVEELVIGWKLGLPV